MERVEKVVVFGGGSFGTAMGVSLARQSKAGQASHVACCAVCDMLCCVGPAVGVSRAVQGNAEQPPLLCL